MPKPTDIRAQAVSTLKLALSPTPVEDSRLTRIAESEHPLVNVFSREESNDKDERSAGDPPMDRRTLVLSVELYTSAKAGEIVQADADQLRDDVEDALYADIALNDMLVDLWIDTSVTELTEETGDIYGITTISFNAEYERPGNG